MNDLPSAPIPPSGPPPRIRTVPAVLAPFWSIGLQIVALFEVPLAFVGGVFGASALSVGLALFFVYGSNLALAAEPEEEDELEIEFEPGELVRLGEKHPEDKKVVVEETVAAEEEEEIIQETVTKEEEPPPEPPEEKPPEPPKPKPKKKPIEKPDPNKRKDVKKSDRNRENKFKDLPNAEEERGDPFGDPGGWSDLRKDGDPWATAVMKALNDVRPPAFAAKLPNTNQSYKFKLTICKDGTIGKVLSKGSSGDKQIDDAVRGELERTKIPKPPAHVAKQMGSKQCVSLKYTFTWGGQGKVR